MKKIFGILLAFLLPTVSFAQGYMMNSFNRGYGYNNVWVDNSMFGIFLLVPILGVIFVVCVFIFWLLMLIDAIKHSPEKMKIAWILVIIFTHIIGAFIYYFVEK